MAETTNQVNVSQVILLSASGRRVDLSYIYTNITIHESIGATAVSGSIVVDDDNDHFEILPIIGQETLHIVFDVLGESFTYDFRVYKLSNIERINARSSSYQLHFVSNEMVVNEKNRVSRSYANQPYSSMILDIMSTDIGTTKNIGFDETQNVATHVVPNLRPFNAINQILKKCVSSSSGASNYIFFEDRMGYSVAPLASFVEQETKYTYRYIENIGPDGANEYMVDPFAIMKLDVVKQSDMLDLTNQGFFASQLHSIDLLQRKVDVYDYNYFDLFNEVKHLNRYPIFFKDEQFNIEGQQYFTYSNETALDNSYVSDNYSSMDIDISSQFRARRMIQSMMFSNYVINMSIAGNILLFVGDVIDIDTTSSANKSEGRQHRTISGRSLVTAITSIFTAGQGFIQRIELSKDSLAQDLGEDI